MDYEEIMLMRADAAKKEAREAVKHHVSRQKAISEEVEYNAMWNKLASLDEQEMDIMDFRHKLTEAFVTEGLTVFIDNCVEPHLIKEEYNQKLVRQLTSNFVKEEGATKLLNKMKKTSNLMSELAYIIENTVQSIVEKADNENTATFQIDQKDKDTFYKELGKIDADKAVTKIENRVKEQVNDFVTDNMKYKAELAANLSNTQAKVTKAKEQAAEKAANAKEQAKAATLEHAYIEMGKDRDMEIRESHTKSIFECMVYNLSKAAMVNEAASQAFIENARLNMDKIVEHCEVMYTFITALDSTKLINADEAYLRNMLDEMKH